MSVVPYRAYRTRDGFLTVAIFVEKFWAGLCNVIGRPELGRDERYDSTAKRLERRAEVDAVLEEVFPLKTTEDWMKLLEAEGVPAAPVLTIDRVFEHPQVLERGMVVEVEHPAGGVIKMIGNPVRQPEVDEQPLAPTPRLGQHTDEVLRRLLNYDEERLSRLRSEGVI